jgi:hypothetical protein
LLEIYSNGVYERIKSSLYYVHMGEGVWENSSTNKFSNTSQLVMVPGNNEQYHSRASPHRVCNNNRHVTLSSVRLKTSHVLLNLNKCFSASFEVFPKIVEKISIGISSIWKSTFGTFKGVL